MGQLTDTQTLNNQYGTADKLNTRISIHSRYSTNKQGFGNWITSHYRIREGMKPEDWDCPTEKPDFEGGGGGLFSSVKDYSRFAQMLLNGGTLDGERILGRKTIDLISRDHLTPEQQATHSWDTQRGYGYGLGVRVMTNPEMADINGSVGEWGWDGMFGNWFCVDPKENLTCVYMTTNLPGDHYRFIPKLMASMYASL